MSEELLFYSLMEQANDYLVEQERQNNGYDFDILEELKNKMPAKEAEELEEKISHDIGTERYLYFKAGFKVAVSLLTAIQ